MFWLVVFVHVRQKLREEYAIKMYGWRTKNNNNNNTYGI